MEEIWRDCGPIFQVQQNKPCKKQTFVEMIWVSPPKLGWKIQNWPTPQVPKKGAILPTSYWWMFLAVFGVMSYISLLNLYPEIWEENWRCPCWVALIFVHMLLAQRLHSTSMEAFFFRHKPPEGVHYPTFGSLKSLKNRGGIFDLHLRWFLQKFPQKKSHNFAWDGWKND